MKKLINLRDRTKKDISGNATSLDKNIGSPSAVDSARRIDSYSFAYHNSQEEERSPRRQASSLSHNSQPYNVPRYINVIGSGAE